MIRFDDRLRMSGVMSEEFPYRVSFVQRQSGWLWLPIVGYLLATPFLGLAAFFVPIVVYLAPLGILTCLGLDEAGDTRGRLIGLYFLFWSLWLIGFLGREKLPRSWLKGIWHFLALMEALAIIGFVARFGTKLWGIGKWG